MISALFGKAFCQDGIGIGCGESKEQNHSVIIIKKDWNNEEERINLVSKILQHFPSFSAQLDVNGQLTFHDYSMLSSSSSLDDIIQLISQANYDENLKIEEKRMKSKLVDQTEYENLLMLLESSHMRRLFNILRETHARLFSGYGCGSLTLPSISIKRRQKRRELRQSKLDKNNVFSITRPHSCSLIFSYNRPCMCLTDNVCFCNYTLTFTAYFPFSPPS